MAKGAAKETKLGKLHDRLADVFIRVLERYETRMKAPSQEDLEADMLDEILEFEPSPAMLSAIAKFLKDNEIGIDVDQQDKLSATQMRLDDLKNRRAGRADVTSLTSLSPVGNA